MEKSKINSAKWGNDQEEVLSLIPMGAIFCYIFFCSSLCKSLFTTLPTLYNLEKLDCPSMGKLVSASVDMCFPMSGQKLLVFTSSNDGNVESSLFTSDLPNFLVYLPK